MQSAQERKDRVKLTVRGLYGSALHHFAARFKIVKVPLNSTYVNVICRSLSVHEQVTGYTFFLPPGHVSFFSTSEQDPGSYAGKLTAAKQAAGWEP